MLNLASWYYRNLLGDNELIETPDNYQIKLINGRDVFESNVSLKNKFRPSWLSKSALYKDCDGSGTSEFQNIAVYKAISEALERMAFYEFIDSRANEFAFDLNPTTTGMASFPHFFKMYARINAKKEAIERWAIHEFNRSRLPIKEHHNNIENLIHYEISVPFKQFRVSLLKLKTAFGYVYGFACGDNLKESYSRAIVELDRNKRVLTKMKGIDSLPETLSSLDKTFLFFSSNDGEDYFNNLIINSPKAFLVSNPKIVCDKELKGKWSEYTVVWRFLFEDSYYDNGDDYKFFMF